MIGAVEQAIIDRLKQAETEAILGYRWGAVGSYAGELDAEVTALVGNGRFPAAWVVYAGSKRRDGSQGVLRLAAFSVVCAASGGRNEQERRHGSGGHVGAYQLVEDVCGLLDGQSLGLDILPIEISGDRTIFNGAATSQRLAVYAIDLVTGWRGKAATDAGTLDDFATFHAAWDLPPHDGESDAADTIELPIQEEA